MARVDQATGQLKPEAPRPPPMPSHGMVDPYAPSHGMVDPYAQMAQYASAFDAHAIAAIRYNTAAAQPPGLRRRQRAAAAAGLRTAASRLRAATGRRGHHQQPALPEPEIPRMRLFFPPRARRPTSRRRRCPCTSTRTRRPLFVARVRDHGLL